MNTERKEYPPTQIQGVTRNERRTEGEEGEKERQKRRNNEERKLSPEYFKGKMQNIRL